MTILQIDRSIPFDPIAFFGAGHNWSIVEQDERSLNLTEIDLDKIMPVVIISRSVEIDGHDLYERLKLRKEYIRLDAKVLQTLWENKELIPESWKQHSLHGDSGQLYFPGTIMGTGGDTYHMPSLCWDAFNQEWWPMPYWMINGGWKFQPLGVLSAD